MNYLEYKPERLVTFLHISGQESSDFLINPANMALSAYLKANGYNTNVYVINGGTDIKDIVDKIYKSKPIYLAISVYSISYYLTSKIVKELRKYVRIPILAGGYHVTADYNNLLNSNLFDYLCIGEGEDVVVGLANMLYGGKVDINKINGLVCKLDGKVHISIPKKVMDIEALPFWDRELYDTPYMQAYSIQKLGKTIPIYTGKGCPYMCSFCSNHILSEIYGKKIYQRKRDINKIIFEMKQIINKYTPDSFLITDEQFLLDFEWFSKFADLYAKTINIPYFIMANANSINEKVVNKLKDSNCLMVVIGIEVKDEVYRSKILKKYISNDKIYDVFKLLKKYGIKSCAAIMTGLPYETKKQIEDTIDFIEELEPNLFLASVYNPLPGTQLRQYCEQNDLLTTVTRDWIEERFSHHYTNREFQLLRVDENKYLRVKFTNISEDDYLKLSDRIDNLTKIIEGKHFKDYEQNILINRVLNINEKTNDFLVIVRDNYRYKISADLIPAKVLKVNYRGLSESLFELNQMFELVINNNLQNIIIFTTHRDYLKLYSIFNPLKDKLNIYVDDRILLKYKHLRSVYKPFNLFFYFPPLYDMVFNRSDYECKIRCTSYFKTAAHLVLKYVKGNVNTLFSNPLGEECMIIEVRSRSNEITLIVTKKRIVLVKGGESLTYTYESLFLESIRNFIRNVL